MSRFSCRWPKAQSTTLSPRHHFNRLDQPLALREPADLEHPVELIDLMPVANGAQVVEFLVLQAHPRVDLNKCRLLGPSRHLLQLHKGGRDRRTADIAVGLRVRGLAS